MDVMRAPRYRVTDVQALDGFRLRLAFADGSEGDADLSDIVARGRVFGPLRDPDEFSRAFLDTEQGTVAWPNGADLAPEMLYDRAMKHPRRKSRVNWLDGLAGLVQIVHRLSGIGS
jgi:hypothetical protein